MTTEALHCRKHIIPYRSVTKALTVCILKYSVEQFQFFVPNREHTLKIKVNDP